MADKLIGGLFARARNATRRRYAASAGDVGRLMRLFHGTIDALAAAQAERPRRLRGRGRGRRLGQAAAGARRGRGAGRPRRARIRCCRAADRWRTLRKFAPDLIEALEFRAARADDPVLAALRLLADLNRSGKRDVPPDAPMPFRKEWRRLVAADGTPDRRLYETAVLATLRDRLRSGDVWVERSSDYRRFDSYLLPAGAVPAAAAELGLPATADEWLATRGAELDRRLRRFARRLRRGELEGVELRDGRLHVAPVRAQCLCQARHGKRLAQLRRRPASPCQARVPPAPATAGTGRGLLPACRPSRYATSVRIII